jgi:hypothetical protein
MCSVKILPTQCVMVGVWPPMAKFFLVVMVLQSCISWIQNHLKVILRCAHAALLPLTLPFPFNIYFHAVTKMVTVKYQDNEIPFINELEYIDGEVWANVWQVRCQLSPWMAISYAVS